LFRTARRRSIPLVLALLVGASLGAAAPARSQTVVGAVDIATQIGISLVSKSWSANVGDYDADGDQDLMIVPHNQMASRLYRNDDGMFTEVFPGLFKKRDRHDCAWGDANVDGRLDLYCTVGTSSGTAANPKELWIQQTAGGFIDRAAAWGVTDDIGRGRTTTFVDVNHDRYPDLFVGNEYPRQDGKPSPNRLFINANGSSFTSAPSYGLDVEVGGMCVQAADFDRDGWEDLLVCGQTALHLYRNNGGTSFTDVAGSWGVGSVVSGLHNALLADLAGDGKLDLVVVTQTSLRVFPQTTSRFGSVSYQLALKAGRWVAAGDFQGDGHQDLYVVQKCRNGINDPDYLLLGDGTGSSFVQVTSLPQASEGCGDVVEPIDRNGDGKDEFVVLNGLGYTAQGPVQVISASAATGTACTISGTSGADHLIGTSGDDVICGLGGNDILEGRGGADLLLGGDGNDTLIGGPGPDRLTGGAGTDLASYAERTNGVSGNDTLIGSAVANRLTGGAGNDTLRGGGAADKLIPGAGDDTVIGDAGRDIVSFLAGPVTVDLATGSASGEGADTISTAEIVQGSPQGDTIIGSDAAETLNGLGGTDRITGGRGADSLLGGGGGDILDGVDGVGGNDTLDGKEGTDSCSADPNDVLISCP
jgi:hypothetical protein